MHTGWRWRYSVGARPLPLKVAPIQRSVTTDFHLQSRRDSDCQMSEIHDSYVDRNLRLCFVYRDCSTCWCCDILWPYRLQCQGLVKYLDFRLILSWSRLASFYCIHSYIYIYYIDGLAHERRNSIANALELRLAPTHRYQIDRGLLYMAFPSCRKWH